MDQQFHLYAPYEEYLLILKENKLRKLRKRTERETACEIAKARRELANTRGNATR